MGTEHSRLCRTRGTPSRTTTYHYLSPPNSATEDQGDSKVPDRHQQRSRRFSTNSVIRWTVDCPLYLPICLSPYQTRRGGGEWEGMAFNGNDISSVQFTRPHPVLLNREVVEEDHSTIFIIIILNRWPNFKPNSQFECSCGSGRKEEEKMRREVVVLNVHPPKHGCVSPVGPQLL